MRTLSMTAILLCLAPGVVEAQTARLAGDLPRKQAGPIESTAGLETLYDAVTLPDGRRLRVMLTRPSGARTRLGAIFHTQAVSCESLAWPETGESRMRGLALRSGRVLIRVERSGTGDSEGPGCDKLDFDTEVADYRHALVALRRHPWIDPARIVIWGSSLGSMTAPLVADGNAVEGVIVQGGGGLTYLERMIGFDRLNLDRAGRVPPERRHAEMLRRIRFQTHYLLERKTPAEVVSAHPDLAGVWESLLGTDERPYYGRPYAWHWQAARRDVLGVWARIVAPVLVLYGDYEGFEYEHGHRTIAETVNALRPGSATFVRVDRAGHDLRLYPDPFSAYAFKDGTVANDLFWNPILSWLGKLGG